MADAEKLLDKLNKRLAHESKYLDGTPTLLMSKQTAHEYFLGSGKLVFDNGSKCYLYEGVYPVSFIFGLPLGTIDITYVERISIDELRTKSKVFG